MSNIVKDRDAFSIAETYAMLPGQNAKYEMTYTQTFDSWAFFANARHSTKIHVKFDAEDLPDEP